MNITNPESCTYLEEAAGRKMSYYRQRSLARAVSYRAPMIKKNGDLADSQYTDQYFDRETVMATLRRQKSCGGSRPATAPDAEVEHTLAKCALLLLLPACLHACEFWRVPALPGGRAFLNRQGAWTKALDPVTCTRSLGLSVSTSIGPSDLVQATSLLSSPWLTSSCSSSECNSVARPAMCLTSHWFSHWCSRSCALLHMPEDPVLATVCSPRSPAGEVGMALLAQLLWSRPHQRTPPWFPRAARPPLTKRARAAFP